MYFYALKALQLRMRLEVVAMMPFTVRGMCVESDTETNTCVTVNVHN